MADIELLKRLIEACNIERCATIAEHDRNLNEFYSVLEPEDVAALIAENERLRQIISDSATACGAAMSPECTVEFMGHLPAEIAGVLGQLCAELERVKAEGLALLVNARPFLASRLTELPSIREQVENPEAVDRAVEKLSALVSHIDAAMGKGGDAENCRCNEKLQVVQELQAEREALASLLRRFVENEHNPDEDQNDRHWYFTEAETLLAKIGGKYPDYALVPEEALYAQRAELERVRGDVNFFNQQCRHEKLTSMQLQAENERLRKLLAECTDSLESEILDRYGLSKDHPAMRRKFERDMQDVIEARAALGKEAGGHSAENQAEARVNPGSGLAGAVGNYGGAENALKTSPFKVSYLSRPRLHGP